VVDRNIGLDVDISIRCNGEYSYRIENPLLFYTNVCGNVADTYSRTEIDSMLKSELLTALQPAFARISEMGIRYSALPGHTAELAEALNEVLSAKWREMRGLCIASFGVNSVNASAEDEQMIKDLQRTAVMRNPGMAGATLVSAQADAMKAAAANENGAMMGFMGMNMAMGANGGANAQNFFAMDQQQQAARTAQPAEDGWKCACGAVNKGKFCSECGAKKPSGAIQYKCDKCGWEPEKGSNPPKFCPECGDAFDNGDIVG
jgi:membrane protease subunit (stomatin/prohibitin family)